VATSIGVTALAAGVLLWGYTSKTCAALFSFTDMTRKSDSALERLSQVIRNTRTVRSCSGSQLVLIDMSGGTNTIAYSSDTQTLRLTQSNRTSTLLTECTNFQVSVYQRTPVSNSMALNTNGYATNTAKVVTLNWTCKRALRGDKNNIDLQTSAKVVLRNL